MRIVTGIFCAFTLVNTLPVNAAGETQNFNNPMSWMTPSVPGFSWYPAQPSTQYVVPNTNSTPWNFNANNLRTWQMPFNFNGSSWPMTMMQSMSGNNLYPNYPQGSVIYAPVIPVYPTQGMIAIPKQQTYPGTNINPALSEAYRKPVSAPPLQTRNQATEETMQRPELKALNPSTPQNATKLSSISSEPPSQPRLPAKTALIEVPVTPSIPLESATLIENGLEFPDPQKIPPELKEDIQ